MAGDRDGTTKTAEGLGQVVDRLLRRNLGETGGDRIDELVGVLDGTGEDAVQCVAEDLRRCPRFLLRLPQVVELAGLLGDLPAIFARDLDAGPLDFVVDRLLARRPAELVLLEFERGDRVATRLLLR